MATYQDLSPSEAKSLVRSGDERVQTNLGDTSGRFWVNIRNVQYPDYYFTTGADHKFRLVVAGEKTIRYDFLDKSLAPTAATPEFETEAQALEVLRDYTDDGVAEDDEYIIYKITYEPVKRLRVKINTTLEEIQ